MNSTKPAKSWLEKHIRTKTEKKINKIMSLMNRYINSQQNISKYNPTINDHSSYTSRIYYIDIGTVQYMQINNCTVIRTKIRNWMTIYFNRNIQ